MVSAISRVFQPDQKIACFTLDYETDYGDRVGDFNILKSSQPELEELIGTIHELEVPLSAFVCTDMFAEYPASFDLVRKLACDFHSHSHTHNTRNFDSKHEIGTSAQIFEDYFGHRPVGYRAPQGVLYPGDIDLLRDHGYGFSASVFPSYRPGKFNHLRMPLAPFRYENGIVELPFAVVPKLRYTVSLSYLKLLGYRANRIMHRLLGLPPVLIFDSHLHDYITNEQSFQQLPRKLRMAWGINKHSGLSIFRSFVQTLKAQGYQFVTMTSLYEQVRKALG